MKKFAILAATAALMISGAAQAALTQGVLSDTASVGSLDINATIVPMVSIRNLDDIALTINTAAINNPSGTWAVFGTSNYCVYSNVTAAGDYTIRADDNVGTSSGQVWRLAGAGGSTLEYVVHFLDQANAGVNGDPAYPNGTKRSYKNTAGGVARASDLACTGLGGSNASLSVRIAKSKALAAVAGIYTGTLTITVSAT